MIKTENPYKKTSTELIQYTYHMSPKFLNFKALEKEMRKEKGLVNFDVFCARHWHVSLSDPTYAGFST